MAQQTSKDHQQLRMMRIAELAESIAVEEFGLGRVDPLEVIKSIQGLTSSFGNYGDHFDGLLHCDGTRFHIYCNVDRCEESGRQTFTYAHELGHYFIDEHRLWLLNHPDSAHCSMSLEGGAAGSYIVEKEANHFAGHLLMPSASLKKKVGMPAPRPDAIIEAAQFFRTSLTATAMRFVLGEIFPCAIAFVDPKGTIRWWKLSPWVAYINGGHKAFRHSLRGLDSASASMRMLNAGQGGELFYESPVVAETWFPGLAEHVQKCPWAFENSMAQLNEFAINLGRFGFLVLIAGNEWVQSKLRYQAGGKRPIGGQV